MVNRLRNECIEIKLTKEEKNLFLQKMKLARFRNMSLFIRKCVLEKEIYVVDLEPFRKLEGRLDDLGRKILQIHALLLNRTTSKQENAADGHHENPSH